MPCVPYAGDGVGFVTIPPVGTGVWVEFEGGDPDFPIWSGCFWVAGEPSRSPQEDDVRVKVFKTETVTMRLNDDIGGFSVQVKLPHPGCIAKLEANADGMTISWGSNSVRLGIDGISINGSILRP